MASAKCAASRGSVFHDVSLLDLFGARDGEFDDERASERHVQKSTSDNRLPIYENEFEHNFPSKCESAPGLDGLAKSVFFSAWCIGSDNLFQVPHGSWWSVALKGFRSRTVKRD